MKWILLFICVMPQLPLLAAEQYSQFDCDNLKDRVEFIKKRTSSGYDIDASSSLVAKDFAVIRDYQIHCQHPVDTVRVIRGAVQDPSVVTYTSSQVMPIFSAQNNTFEGAKADAWTEFYQVPRQCRKKQLAESEFVACAEHKADQRAKFEQRWQSENAARATLTVAQPATMAALKPVVLSEGAATAVSSIDVATEDPSLLQYWQALAEQNQRFQWYGVVMLLLMAIAGGLAWRK